MALVIFCVALVEAMRLRRSLRLGMSSSLYPTLVMFGLAPGMTAKSRKRLHVKVLA
jgi:hypothetical protein